jgi:hypothetical protein
VPLADHSALYARIAAELTRTGSLKWREGQLRTILIEAAAKLPERDLGWVSKKSTNALIERLLMASTKESTAESAFSEPDDILGPDWAAHFNE